MWALRWALVALGLVLAAVLISRGNVVIGVLVGAMAVLRGALFLQWHRRRQQFRRRFPGARP